MKTHRWLTLLPAFIPVVFLTVACGKPTGQGTAMGAQNTSLSISSTPTLRYELTDGTACSTGTRHFGSLTELCLNLQIDANNNSCAVTQRETLFKADCQKLIWDPATAATTLLHQTGAYVACDLTQTDPTTNVTTTIHQETSGRAMTLILNNSTASVQTLFRKGNFYLDLALTASDNISSLTQQEWQDEAPPIVTFALKKSAYAPQIICTPSIVTNGDQTPVDVK